MLNDEINELLSKYGLADSSLADNLETLSDEVNIVGLAVGIFEAKGYCVINRSGIYCFGLVLRSLALSCLFVTAVS